MSKTIDFSVNRVSVNEALLKLSSVSEIDIAFSKDFFDPSATITAHFDNETPVNILRHILSDTNIDYKVLGNRILLFRQKLRFHTLSGYLEDGETGERLIAATVYCPTLKKGTTTNEYGFYSLTLPAGESEVFFSYIGYQTMPVSVDLKKNMLQNVQLQHTLTLAEVIITPEEPFNANSDDNSSILTLSKKLTGIMPNIGGVADPVRIAQLSAGIEIGGDGLDGISVRGGDAGQNLMLLDGVPVYIPYHLFGLFSVYNPNTVNTARVYKGSFPARFGGRLSSIFDVRIREGNQYRWSGSASANLLHADFLLEGPIKKGKGAVLLAGRSTHSDFLLSPFFQETYFSTDTENMNLGFNDFNFKTNYTFSDKDRLYLSFYSGTDKNNSEISYSEESEEFEQSTQMNWSNSILALRWNHLFNDQLFLNTTLTYSRFSHEYSILYENYEEQGEEEMLEEAFYLDWYSSNQDVGVKFDFDFSPSLSHHFRFGGGVSRQEFVPVITYLEDTDSEFEEIEDININVLNSFRERRVLRAVESSIYLEDRFRPSALWNINAGLRATNLLSEGGSYFRLEPRLSVSYQWAKNFSTDIAVSRMVQFLHLVSNSNIRLPNDLWVPSKENLLPQESWQQELNIRWQLAPQTSFITNFYYKKLNNLYTFSDEYTFNLEDYREYLVLGTGEASGLELTLHHQTERTGGQIAYSFAHSSRQFDEVNGGEAFAHLRDQPHQVKLYFYQKIGSNFSIGLNWMYASQGLIPTINALDAPEELLESAPSVQNENRFAHHRLDVNATWEFEQFKLKHTLQLGVYNLYNQRNISYYRPEFDLSESDESDASERLFFKPVYSLPFRPSVSYQLAF